GALWASDADDAGGGRSARRFLRIAIRLAMSFGLAWLIAIFLELAIFSDTIGDRIKQDHIAINQPVYQKIEQYEAGLGNEIAQLRAKRDDLRSTQARVAADAATRRGEARAAIQGKRDALRAQIEVARADLKELEAARLTRVEDFRQKALAASDFQKQKDD